MVRGGIPERSSIVAVVFRMLWKTFSFPNPIFFFKRPNLFDSGSDRLPYLLFPLDAIRKPSGVALQSSENSFSSFDGIAIVLLPALVFASMTVNDVSVTLDLCSWHISSMRQPVYAPIMIVFASI